jgi:hypothetical protein
MVKKGIQLFKWWGVNLIRRLLVTLNRNKWIIIAINYTTDWLVTKAIPNTTNEAIAEFLHKEIFINYGAFNELVSNNRYNLLLQVIEVFIKILKAKHCIITLSHPQINRKNENLNSLLSRMLMKYLISKLT